MKTIVIAIATQKGGVAKTATAGALIAALKRMGHSVLGIDMDPQANLTDNLGGADAWDSVSIYNVLKKEKDICEGIWQTPMCDFVPATILLAGIETELNSITGRECRLREVLKKVKAEEKYNFIIIDTPPSLGTLTINALVAADYVVIPTMSDMSSTKGIDQLYSTITNVREYFNENLKIAGILFTRFNARTNIGREILERTKEIATEMETKVFERTIRPSVVVPEANAMAKDLWTYSPESTVAQDYEAFALELVKEVV